MNLLGTAPIFNMGLRYAHVMSEIITEADVTMKKLLRTRVFPGFGAMDVYGAIPLPPKIINTVPYPSQKTWYVSLNRKKNVKSVLLS